MEKDIKKFDLSSRKSTIRFSYIIELLFQVWNHDFFWETMQPEGGHQPVLGLLQQIEKDFGSFTNFREKFVEAALTLFGSGWVWLVCKFQIYKNNSYRIIYTK